MTSSRMGSGEAGYGFLVDRIAGLLESARRASARAVNAVMTVTYWEIGRRIVEFEQGGRKMAEYGEELLAAPWAVTYRPASAEVFPIRNLLKMRFVLSWMGDFADAVGQMSSCGRNEGRGCVPLPLCVEGSTRRDKYADSADTVGGIGCSRHPAVLVALRPV